MEAELKKIKGMIDTLQRLVTAHQRKIVNLETQVSRLKGIIQQQKNDIAHLSRKQ